MARGTAMSDTEFLVQSYLYYPHKLSERPRVGAPLEEEPSRLWTLLQPGDPPSGCMAPEHWKNAFLEDKVHDWVWRKGTLRYYSRVSEGEQWLLLETRKTLPYEMVHALYYYDAPILSIVRLNGELHLEAWDDDTDLGARYHLSPCTEEEAQKLLADVRAGSDDDIPLMQEIQKRGPAWQLTWGTSQDRTVRLCRVDSVSEDALVGSEETSEDSEA